MKTEILGCLFLVALLALIPACTSTPANPLGPDVVAPKEDPGWPREFSDKGQTITVFQPQIDEWKDYHVIRYRAAKHAKDLHIRLAFGHEVGK